MDLDEVDRHPHNACRNSYVRKNDVVMPVPAPKLSATPGASSMCKPIAVRGQHNNEILKSLGYLQDEIDGLIKNKIIFEEPKSNI